MENVRFENLGATVNSEQSQHIEMLAIAERAAREAGGVLLEEFGKSPNITAKADGTLVTETDIRAEGKIINAIKDAYPKHNILSEEGSPGEKPSKFCWIIDPLDGTHNFIRGIPVFGTSIALAMEGEVILGVIYMPIADEMYTALKDNGAYLNAKKISVSSNNLAEATIIYDSGFRRGGEAMLKGLGRIAENAFNIRMTGSTARGLSFVAEGKVDAEIEYTDKIWDFAAGAIIVEEAGGMVTGHNGKKWTLNTTNYLISNKVIHSQILSLIADT